MDLWKALPFCVCATLCYNVSTLMYKIVSFDLQSYRYLCADRKHDSAGYALSGLTLSVSPQELRLLRF